MTIMDHFCITSAFRGLLHDDLLPEEAGAFKDFILQNLESSNFGGFTRAHPSEGHQETWTPFPSANSLPPPPEITAILLSAHPDISSSSQKITFDKVSRGTVSFSTSSLSSRDSQISYRDRNGTITFGSIYFMMAEVSSMTAAAPSIPPTDIFLIVERYGELPPADQARDPYRQHPLLGDRGYKLAWLVRQKALTTVDVISAKDVVGHIALCPLRGEHGDAFDPPVQVGLQLDRVSATQCAHGNHLLIFWWLCRITSQLPLTPTPFPVSRAGAVFSWRQCQRLTR